MKRILCLIIATALLCTAVNAAAADKITGASITANGEVFWNEYPGNEQYWLGVDGQYVPAEIGDGITDRALEPGVHTVCIDSTTDGGNTYLATVTFEITFNGKTYAKGSKGAVCGWSDAEDDERISSLSVNGEEIPRKGGAFVDAGTDVSLAFTVADGYSAASAFLRYNGEDEEIYPVSSGDGSYHCDVTAPDAVWTVVIKTAKTVAAGAWICPDGDLIASFELEGTAFDGPRGFAGGGFASATVVPREGYALTDVFLRCGGEDIKDGVTVTKHENNEYDVSFTVPDSDFDIIVRAAEDRSVTVSFDGNGGEGFMEPVTVENDESYTMPESAFKAPGGLVFSGWVLLDSSTGEQYAAGAPGDERVIDRDTVMRAVWDDPAVTESTDTTSGAPDETEDITTAADTDAAETSDTGTTAQTAVRPADTSGTEPVSVKTEKRSVLPWILLGVGIGIAVCAAVSFSAYLILKKSSAAGIKKKTRNGKEE